MRTRGIRALATLAALAVPVALGACGSEDDAASAAQQAGNPRPSGHLMKQTIPAQIDPRPQGFISRGVLRPAVNAWRVSSRRQLTEVDAGALAHDPSTGALAIFRHRFLTAEQDVTLVEVKNAGPLEITEAPLGSDVQESAQRRGKIGFVSADGVRGTLDLSNDRVRLRGR